MKLTATQQTDDEGRPYYVLTNNHTGDAVNVFADVVENRTQPLSNDVREWAAEAGHEITNWKMEGVTL